MSRQYFDEKVSIIYNDIERFPNLRNGISKYFVYLHIIKPPNDASDSEIQICLEIKKLINNRELSSILDSELLQIKEKVIQLYADL